MNVPAICAATDDFPFWSDPTFPAVVASLRAGPVDCILYNM